MFDVISAAGSPTEFILTLSLHFSAYCGLFETILLSRGPSEDFAAHGVRIPARVSSIAFRPL
jgi:hypothetical protein